MAYIQHNNPFLQTNKRTKPHTSWTQKDRDKYNRENPGKKVRPPQPEGGPRKDAYCARSAGIPKCKNPEKWGLS